MSSLEMYFYNRSGGAVTHTQVQLDTDYAELVPAVAGKKLVLLGFEIIPSAVNNLMDIAFNDEATDTTDTELFIGMSVGSLIQPILVDLRECPPVSATGEGVYGDISGGTAEASFYTMEIE